jgi:hypothetical protein
MVEFVSEDLTVSRFQRVNLGDYRDERRHDARSGAERRRDFR